MKEMVSRLWELYGSQKYITLRLINAEAASKLEAMYLKEYEDAPENVPEEENVFEAALNPGPSSKKQVVQRWAIAIEDAIVKEYINQFTSDELATLRLLISRGGVNARIQICEGVSIWWEDLR